MLMKENGRNSCSCFASAWGEMYETALSIIGAHMKGAWIYRILYHWLY